MTDPRVLKPRSAESHKRLAVIAKQAAEAGLETIRASIEYGLKSAECKEANEKWDILMAELDKELDLD